MIKYTFSNSPATTYNIKGFPNTKKLPEKAAIQNLLWVEMLKKEAVSLDWTDILSTNLDRASPLD